MGGHQHGVEWRRFGPRPLGLCRDPDLIFRSTDPGDATVQVDLAALCAQALQDSVDILPRAARHRVPLRSVENL